MRKRIIQRFIKYIGMDTKSDPYSGKHPSTEKQWNFARALLKELKKIGVVDVTLDGEHCYIYGSIPSNTEKKIPIMGLIAHMDTAPDISGECIHPQIFVYEGGGIHQESLNMEEEKFPVLKTLHGKEIITTDGTTLLGADDKAGVTEIVTAIEYFLEHPELIHGEIKFAFTPDEEIGEGADFFDVERFGADFAYTIDGGALGELQYESFNAASALVKIFGENIHPGSAKGTMVNAMLLAMEFQSMLPVQMRPEFTEAYEGFYHLIAIKGNVEHVTMEYIIRDHNQELFETKKNLMLKTADYLNIKYPGRIHVEIKDSYYNMGEVLKDYPQVVNLAKTAMENLNIKPIIEPIRGGTDGSRLSYMGLPTPNIFTGGFHFHGKYELIPVESMVKAVELIIEMNRLNVG